MDSFNVQPPFLGRRQPDYPVVTQLLRVTAATVPGPGLTGSSAPGEGNNSPSVLYVASTQQMRTDSLAPRDREPCLVTEPNGVTITAGYYIGRLCGTYNSLPVYEIVALAGSGIPGPAGPSGAPGSSSSPDSSLCYSSAGIVLDATSYNDYSPPATWVKIRRSGSPTNINITGINAATFGDGCPVMFTHDGDSSGGGSTTSTITFQCNSTSSSAANRILDQEGTGSTQNLVLTVGHSLVLRYDTTRSRWRVVEEPNAGSTTAGLVGLGAQTMGSGAKYFQDKVGVGTTSPLTNSALDVRGYTYTYLAGLISFGGGNVPTSEADGAIIQYDGSIGNRSISIAIAAASYTTNTAGGTLMQGQNLRFLLRYRGSLLAPNPKFAYFNDDSSTYYDGQTVVEYGVQYQGGLRIGGTLCAGVSTSVPLARLTPAGAPGQLNFTCGFLISKTNPT